MVTNGPARLGSPGDATVDLLIVGAGLVGCEAARHAIERGMRVVVLEAGPRLSTAHIAAQPQTALLEARDRDPAFRPFRARGSAGRYADAGYRQRVGGRSLYWRGIAVPIEEPALADWPAEIRTILQGGPAVPGSYVSTIDALHMWMGDTRLDAARHVEEAALVQSLRQLGYDAGPTPRAIRTLPNGRWEAYRAVVHLPPDCIVPDAQVTAIEPADGHGFRVHAGTERRTSVAARNVLLAAGTFANIALVETTLTRQSTRPRGDAYAVYDHLATGAVRFVPGGAEGAGGADAFESSALLGYHEQSRSNLFVERFGHPHGAVHDVWAMGEQPPDAATALTFVDDVPVLSLTERAAGTVARLVDQQRELVRDLLRRQHVRLATAPGTVGYDTALRSALRDPSVAYLYHEQLGDLDHESGGLGLAGEVTDAAGEVRDCPGLYVCGPGTFPRLGAANPSLTSLALACHVAYQIR